MSSKVAAAARRPFLVALSLALIIYLFHLLHLINFHELDAFDLRLKIRGHEPAHPKVVILEIDDPSLAAVGQWPWPRSVHAVLLDILAKYKPRLVFFDILFTENGPNPEYDQNLAQSTKNIGNVILPFYFYSEKPFGAFFPIPILKEAAVDVGFVNVEPERDGIVRHFNTFIRVEDQIYYHPAILAMFFQIKDAQKAQQWFSTLPSDSDGRLWLNYPGQIKDFKRISFWEVVDAAGGARDEKLKDLFQDSIVLIGQTATGTTDLKATPFTPVEPGVAIQATAVHTLLTEKFFRSSHWAEDLFILILAALLTCWVSQTWPPKQALLMAFGMMTVYTAVNILVFCFLRFILPLFLPLSIIAITYFIALFLKYIEARFQGELIRRELQTAARIQENFLPSSAPEMAGLDIAFECRFIKEVGGDLYDWADLGQGKLGVCVGDVSGKGVPAALYMAKAISEFRRDNKTDVAPNQVNETLNDHLARSGTAGMFLTLFYAVIDTNTKTLSFSSGGHDPMIFYRTKQKKAELITEAQGTPLGLFEGSGYETAQLNYESGDLFVVVTDGIKELRDPKREEFGMERLKALVETLAQKNNSAKEFIADIFKTLNEYQKGADPHDDRTVLCVKFLST